MGGGGGGKGGKGGGGHLAATYLTEVSQPLTLPQGRAQGPAHQGNVRPRPVPPAWLPAAPAPSTRRPPKGGGGVWGGARGGQGQGSEKGRGRNICKVTRQARGASARRQGRTMFEVTLITESANHSCYRISLRSSSKRVPSNPSSGGVERKPRCAQRSAGRGKGMSRSPKGWEGRSLPHASLSREVACSGRATHPAIDAHHLPAGSPVRVGL